MKKKIMTFLLIFSGIFSLTSCQQNEPLPQTKIIIEREEDVQGLLSLTTKDFNDKIANGESFIINYGQSSCITCIHFKGILKNIAVEHNLRIYQMEIDDYLKTHLAETVQYYSLGLVLIQNGQVKYNFNASERWDKQIASYNKDSSIEYVASDLEKYCFFDSPFYEVDKEEALEKIQTNAETYLYFMRKTCADCTAFHKHFLNQWILDGHYAKDKKIYNLNIDPYREVTETGEEAPSYIEFKNLFNLSKEANPKFGYKTGVVPTVQKYVNGELTKMAVIYNDEIDWETLTVVRGYYEDASFIQQTFDTYLDYQEKTTPFYQEKFLEVIDEQKKGLLKNLDKN